MANDVVDVFHYYNCQKVIGQYMWWNGRHYKSQGFRKCFQTTTYCLYRDMSEINHLSKRCITILRLVETFENKMGNLRHIPLIEQNGNQSIRDKARILLLLFLDRSSYAHCRCLSIMSVRQRLRWILGKIRELVGNLPRGWWLL